MNIQRHVLTAAGIVLLHAAALSAVTIEFGSGSFSSLPYTEDGITFTTLPGTEPAVIGGVSGDGHLVAGTNTVPIRIRASAAQPFRLISLDVEQIFRTWRIESSTGDVKALSGIGTTNVDGEPGWTNLNYFDLIHDPAEANGSIRVDNVTFAYVPEPASGSLVGSLSLGVLLGRRRTRRRSSPRRAPPRPGGRRQDHDYASFTPILLHRSCILIECGREFAVKPIPFPAQPN